MRTNQKTIRTGAGTTAQTDSRADRIQRRAGVAAGRLRRHALHGGGATLSRLSRQGVIQRLGKGLYYRPRQTAFGPSRPNMAGIRSLAAGRKSVFPAGIAAANLLGFTTQNAARIELATDSASLPRLFLGQDALVHTRRPAAWRTLTETDAALLDFLRNRGESSELSPEDTVEKLLGYFREPGRFERLLKAAPTEPPRVRAMLGAIGQQLGQSDSVLAELREGLNPLSRFDFGILAALAYARQWQAKECKAHETF